MSKGSAQGVITAAYWSDAMGQQVANVKLTDEKVKLVIPWSEVLEYLYLFPQPGRGCRICALHALQLPDF